LRASRIVRLSGIGGTLYKADWVAGLRPGIIQPQKDSLTMKITTLVTAAALSAFLAGSAFAQTAAPAPAKAAPVAHSAKSIECSKEADAKGLHGKERKKFRAECKKGN
jgi:hypothetical protein